MKKSLCSWATITILGMITAISWGYAFPGYQFIFKKKKIHSGESYTPKTDYGNIEHQLDKLEAKIYELDYAKKLHGFYKPVSILNGPKLQVNWVYDGDTIKGWLKNGKQANVRVLGIDCPETSRNTKCERGFGPNKELTCEEQIPIGKRARQRAIGLLKGKNITLLTGKNENFEAGKYGRLLAYVDIDGRDYGTIMLKEGLCWDYGWKYPHPWQERYEKIQRPLSS